MPLARARRHGSEGRSPDSARTTPPPLATFWRVVDVCADVFAVIAAVLIVALIVRGG